MINRVVVVTEDQKDISHKIDWSKVGRLVSELPELYQVVKESRVDLILVDETAVNVTQSIANRIRRHNGLTEIWTISHREASPRENDMKLDGELSVYLGQEGIRKKVKQILEAKERLKRFGIIGRSQSMKAVGEVIERIGPTEVSVLIVGPSGSGKELVARALHDESVRSDGPFVAINCGALAEGVLESELFGHEKGAFTGSVGKREGLFKRAAGGTIFLDEIGEMKADTQVKLLRVLEDGTYYPVGSSTPERADVRIVAATNRDLTEAIADREFREDLYFRIGAVKIKVPALYERKGDIQALLQHFLAQADDPVDYSDGALALLMKYDWPGNVRQLRNFATRMTALKPGARIETKDVEAFLSEQTTTATQLPVSTGRTVQEAGQELIYRAILSLGNEVRMLRDLITSHLPTDQTQTAEVSPDVVEQTATMEEMEKELISQVLEKTNGNRKETAKRLGIGERTLYRKLNKYGLN